MSIEKIDILALVDKLANRFDSVLLRQAASMQVASSTIAVSARSDIEKVIMQSVLNRRIDTELQRAGFTRGQLDEALTAIRLAGVVAHHLSLIDKPVTNVAAQLAANTLSSVMYPCADKMETSVTPICINHGLMLLFSKLS